MNHQQIATSSSSEPSISDFRRGKVIGKGAFGKVYKAHHEVSKQIYAAKVIKKTDSEIDQHHLANEIAVHKSIDFPFIVKLFHIFENLTKTFFLLEYLPGGTLADILEDLKTLDEEITRFYVMEMTLGLEYLHKNGIVYRDLKPANVLLDRRGHTKLADFGESKFLKKGQKTWTYCGTLEYLAPEIVLEKEYAHAVDIWSLGTVMHEMLLGDVPYTGEDFDEQVKIFTENPGFKIPNHISKYCAALLQNLLNFEAKNRYSFSKIKRSAFFNGMSWETVSQQGYEPPQYEYANDVENMEVEDMENNNFEDFDMAED